MKLDLDPEVEKYIQEKVASGKYSAPSQVIRAAVLLLQEEEAAVAADMEQLRRDLESGLAQLDQGQGKPWDPEEAKTEGRKLRDARRRKVS